MLGLQIIGNNKYQFEHEGVKYIVTRRAVDNGHYCHWEIKQDNWIKGMPIWKSDLHLAEDEDLALHQAKKRLLKTTARVQIGLF